MSLGIRHLRDTVFVDQAMIDGIALDLLDGQSELRIVGRRVNLIGGRLFSDKHDIVVVAEELFVDGRSSGFDPTLVGLLLQPINQRLAEQPGKPGGRITVTCDRLVGLRGDVVARGGRGGNGRNGAPGEPRPDPDWPIDNPPPPMIPGPGSAGADGGQGGVGGTVTLRRIVDAGGSEVHWLAPGGSGGSMGVGGEGDPKGADGDPGGTGAVGTVSFVPIGRSDFVAALREQLADDGFLGDNWLFMVALHFFRRTAFEQFADCVALVDEVWGAATLPGIAGRRQRHLAAALRQRGEHRSHLGIAHDLDVEPRIDAHDAERKAAAQQLRTTLFPDGGTALFTGRVEPRLTTAASELALRLSGLYEEDPANADAPAPAGDLDKWADSATERAKRAAELRDHQDFGADSLRGVTLEALGTTTGTIKLEDGQLLDVATIVTAVEALTTGPVLHPAVPDVVVDPARASEAPFYAGRPDAFAFAGAANDLVHLVDHPTVPWTHDVTGSGVGVNLRAVDAQLRTASGDDVARSLLREHVDLVRQRLTCDLRERQALAEHADVTELARDARDWSRQLDNYDGNLPDQIVSDLVFDLVDGIRIASSVVARHMHLDDRAFEIRAARSAGGLETGALETAMFSPDVAFDVYVPHWAEPEPADPRIPPALGMLATMDERLLAWLNTDNDERRAEWEAHGIHLRPDNSRVTIRRSFTVGDGSGVVERLRDTKTCWFDMALADLPKNAAGKHLYSEVAVSGVGVRLVGAALLQSHVMHVRHGGAGSLAMLTGGVARQRLGPEFVALDMIAGLGGEYGIHPKPTSLEGFGLPGRAVLGSWMLTLPQVTDVDTDDLSAIEVTFDVDGFVPQGTSTIRRIYHTAELIRPGFDVDVHLALTSPAGPGGVPVTVTTSHPELVVVLTGASVPAGQSGSTFRIRAVAPTAGQVVTLTATTPDGASARTLIEIDDQQSAVQQVPVAGAVGVPAVAAMPGRIFAVSAPPEPSPDDEDALAALAREGSATARNGRVAASAAVDPPPSRIVAFNDKLQAVASIDSGVRTRSIAADATRNRLYVLNGWSAATNRAGLTMYDATTLAGLAHQELGAGVADIAVDSAAGLVYVSAWIARRVYVFRADDLKLVDEIGDASFSGPAGLAIDAATNRIFLARTYRSSEPNVEALSVIQRHATGAHTIDRTIPMGTTVQPWDVAVDPLAGFVYVLGLGGGGVPPQLIVLDRRTLTELGRVNTTGVPTSVTAVPGSGVAHVSVFAGVKVIDARRLQAVATIPAAAPLSAAVTPNGQVLAGARDGQLLRAAAPAALTIAEWR